MVRHAMVLACIPLIGFLAASCAPAARKSESASANHPSTICEEPRPQICTAHYDPVCGLLGDGTYKTYSNACSACSDAAVSGHHPGACE